MDSESCVAVRWERTKQIVRAETRIEARARPFDGVDEQQWPVWQDNNRTALFAG